MGLFFAPSPRQTHFDLALAGATVISSRAAEIAGAQGGGTGQKGYGSPVFTEVPLGFSSLGRRSI